METHCTVSVILRDVSVLGRIMGKPHKMFKIQNGNELYFEVKDLNRIKMLESKPLSILVKTTELVSGLILYSNHVFKPEEDEIGLQKNKRAVKAYLKAFTENNGK